MSMEDMDVEFDESVEVISIVEDDVGAEDGCGIERCSRLE